MRGGCPRAAGRETSSHPLRQAAGAAWRTCLSVPALGMPLAAPAPGLCGLCVPGLDVLAARGRKGRGGALSGCGQEVVRLKLECPEKAENEEMEGHLAGSCLALQAGESLPLRRGTAVERASERGYVPREPRLLRAARHTRFLLGGGQPSGRSYGRGREEREASEVAESPSSAESESRVACTLLLIFGSLCRAARRSGSRLTDCSPLEQRAQLRKGLPRCRRGRGSIGGPQAPEQCGSRDWLGA
ncbi:uncharacterized protein LOC142363265 isoform X5 [Opisthocomus hoazin]|uniref:uncharacterized protein LOC142363265 isoform X5 n=1 Tax=Opisthocomus hoazin TaxID=30419 RepID=UPI003F532929